MFGLSLEPADGRSGALRVLRPLETRLGRLGEPVRGSRIGDQVIHLLKDGIHPFASGGPLDGGPHGAPSAGIGCAGRFSEWPQHKDLPPNHLSESSSCQPQEPMRVSFQGGKTQETLWFGDFSLTLLCPRI